MSINVTSNKQELDSRDALGPSEPLFPGPLFQVCLLHNLFINWNDKRDHTLKPKQELSIWISIHTLVEKNPETQIICISKTLC